MTFIRVVSFTAPALLVLACTPEPDAASPPPTASPPESLQSMEPSYNYENPSAEDPEAFDLGE